MSEEKDYERIRLERIERERLDRERQDDRDRDYRFSRNYEERPTAISLFLRLGYDITQNEDVQRLAADLRYAAEKRKYEEDQKPRHIALIGSGFIAIITVAMTIIGQWLVSKFPSVK